MDELADFVLNSCRKAGAIVEPPAYGVYEVLLPDALAERLGVPAYQRFAFDDKSLLPPPDLQSSGDVGADEITRLSYGHPLVESLIEAARQEPACARLYVNDIRLDKRGLADLAHKTLSFPNARLIEQAHAERSRKVADLPESPALGHYVRFNFKAALITDEKREQLLSVMMNAQAGYAVKELTDIEQLTILETTPAFEHLPVMPPTWLPGKEPTVGGISRGRLSRQVLEGLLERAKHAALDELAEPLENLQRRAARFLELDRARLEQYYDDMQHNLKRRLERAADDRRTAIKDKLIAVQAEREAKLADAEAKYRLRVELELINLLIIAQPQLVLPMNIENRTATVTRTVVWNPLLHRIEPLVCDVCGRASPRLFLCTEGHLAHEKCLLPRQCVDCKRVYCRLCTEQMKTCVVCDRPVCASSLNRCPTCGRGTCREHVGLCHADEGEPARILPTQKRGMAESAEAPPESEPRPELALSAASLTAEESEKDKAPPKPPAEKKPEKKPTAARQAARAKRTPHRTGPSGTVPTRRATATGQKIEVYTYAAEPTITAFVVASGGRELATRTWELVEDGIAVRCHCEKGPFCRTDQTVLEPETADEIETQIQAEIEALQREYHVSGKRVHFYYVLHDSPRPERRLLLRGPWKDDTTLDRARTTFIKTYVAQ